MPNPDVLTDAEVAVIIDSLATLRFELHERGTEAPNIDSALRKIEAQVTPDTRGIRIEACPWYPAPA